MANPLSNSQITGSHDPNNVEIPKGANAQQAAFITIIWPYVVAESRRTGIPVEVFIVQSGFETGWGTSWLFRVAHNPAGVGAFDASHGNQFPDLATGFRTYADRLMGRGEGGQGQFVADVQAHKDAATLLDDIQRGPWAASHYNYTLVSTFHSIYGGGSGSSAGTGTGVSGSSGQTATLTSATSTVQGWLDKIPVFGGLLKAATMPAKLAEAVLKLFVNWRYVLQVVIGVTMMVAGTILIVLDTKPGKMAAQAGMMAAAA